MNIKVCGITQLKQLQQLEALDIAFAGLIFDENHPAYCVDKIKAGDLAAADFDVKKVGVFKDAGIDQILESIEDYSLDIIQLNGKESPATCKKLSAETEVIKTFMIDESVKNIDEIIMPYDQVCDYYLFNMGKSRNWSLLSGSKIEKPFFISGDIKPDEAQWLLSFQHPDLYAVDINDQFEKQPGIKDMGLLLKFREALKIK